MAMGILEWREHMEEEWQETADVAPTSEAQRPPFANLSCCYGNGTANATDDGNGYYGGNVTAVTYFPYYQHSLAVAASFILAYLFIFLLCMVGNGLVCLIVLRNRRMRTVTNLFILNLAISDLLVGIFCIPTTLVDNLITGNSDPATPQHRFRCIVYPFKAKLTLMVAKATIALIWVLALMIMCPSAVMLTVKKVKDHYMLLNQDYNHTYPLYSCYENWPNPEMRKVYTTVLFAHIYLAPLTLITLMYGRIGVKLYTTSVLSAGGHPETAPPRPPAPPSGGAQEGRPLISHKKVKVIKMLIVVALLFMLSWLPLWTLMLLTDYAGLDGNQLELLTGYVFPFAHWLAFSNSSVNPIIYGYYNENFKRGFQAVCQPYSWSCCLWRSADAVREGERGATDRRAEGAPGRTCGPRDIGLNCKPLAFGTKNRVYTDGDLTESVRLELEWRKGMGIGSSVYTEGGVPGPLSMVLKLAPAQVLLLSCIISNFEKKKGKNNARQGCGS
ncbi:hypothetical protein JZ751_013845, partial [Albula glossodonta]